MRRDSDMTPDTAHGIAPNDEWTRRGYPPVQFITYAYDDPDEAPVLDVSPTLKRMRHFMEGRSGFVYRVERLPEAEWRDPKTPCYGNEQFVQVIP